MGVWTLLRSEPGRRQLQIQLFELAGPLLARAAGLYRRTLARRVRVIVVVGSLGKTTTTRAVSAALGQSLDRQRNGTGGAVLARTFLRVGPFERRVVFEVGIDGFGQMAGYAAMFRPDIVVVTSIGSEHNRSFSNLETTRDEKAAMLRALPPSGLAVLNGDDPHVRWMATQTRARIVWFGLDPSAEPRATDLALDWPRGMRFMLHLAGERHQAQIRLVGRHQIGAILAAVGVAVAEAVPLDQILERLAALPPTEGRLQPVPLPNGAWLLRDEFKSSLETIDAALDLLAEIPAPRRIVLLGDISEPPGSQGPLYRRLGERLGRIADRVVLVGTQARKYAVGFRRTGRADDRLVNVGHDLQRAADLIAADLGPGDVVLIKGRDYQRLERAAFLLQGRAVRCELTACRLNLVRRCGSCVMLERGWGAQPG